MKVGIYTLPFHSNYGGILQAWALQETLKKAGFDPVFLRQPGFQAPWALQPLAIGRRALLRFRGSPVPLLARFHDERLETHIVRFWRKKLQLSPVLGNSFERAAFVRKEGLRAVVAGSDQIWRPGVTNPSYYLDFLDDVPSVRRIAYAASFGCDQPDFGTETEHYGELIRKFDMISVREDDAVSLCERLAGIRAEHVVDPTLLLSTADYEAVATPKWNGGPIGYFLAGAKHFRSLLGEVSRRLGTTLTILPTASDKVDDLFPEPMPSVEDWIGTIATSNCVLTDSFHGTVFAILFRKPFVSLDNGSGAGRIRSLLRLLGMEERMPGVLPNADSAVKLLQKAITEETYARLDVLINRSRTFLEHALCQERIVNNCRPNHA